jgi:hypothetical protein
VRHEHARVIALGCVAVAVVVVALAPRARLQAGARTPRSRPNQTIELLAAGDTWVHEQWDGDPTPTPPANGSQAEIVTGIHDAAGTWVGLVAFDLSALPVGAQVEQATLELYSVGSRTLDPTKDPDSIIYPLLGPWSESAALMAVPPYRTEAARAPVPAGAWVRWDVTEVARAWQAGMPNYGLAITAYSRPEAWAWYSSREGQHPPRLLLNLGPSATGTPGTPLPDLWGGTAMVGCGGGLHVTVRNVGLADAGPFTVRSDRGEPSWRVPGLAAGSAQNLPPVPARYQRGLWVDADNEVAESNELNNFVTVAVPSCNGYLPFLARAH